MKSDPILPVATATLIAVLCAIALPSLQGVARPIQGPAPSPLIEISDAGAEARDLYDWIDLSLKGATLFLAVGGAAIAYIRYARDQRRDRHIRARDAWSTYLGLAFENPTLSAGFTDRKDVEKFEKYEWFVTRMLYAAEEVLELNATDEFWKHAIRTQINYHRNYFDALNRSFLNSYSPSLQKLIKAELGYA